MSWLIAVPEGRRRWPRRRRPALKPLPAEPRLTCCTIPTCSRCGGHDPLSGHGDVCRCGADW